MRSKSTRTAQSGIFPLGKVKLPIPPAIEVSTVLFPSMAALAPLDKVSLCRSGNGDPYANFYYGGVGTPTTATFAKAVADLEGGAFSVLTPSGQSAIAATLSVLLQRGDHALIVDTITYTTRWYCERYLTAAGVDLTYYDPALGAEISQLIRPNTRVIFMESPGSMTFEVQDVPSICAVAVEHGIVTVLDNTWAGSVFFEPFRHGVDISILSLTKYHAAPVGVSLGGVVTNDELLYEKIKEGAALLGLHVSADACAKAATALSTLHLRMKYQQESAKHVINGLLDRPEVRRIMHPSLPACSGHAIWRRDFAGANSLVSLEFSELCLHEVNALADRFRFIRIGYGWGGAISVITVFDPNEWRTASLAAAAGPCMRIYLGLEDPTDLLADIHDSLDSVQPIR
jgi:cystathionine beta-lyase